MTTSTEHLQNLWRRYEHENNYTATGTREVVEWAVQNGLLELPEVDPKAVLAARMSRALREEYDVDSKGRKYRKNHALRVQKNGVQHTMWGIMGHTAPEFQIGCFTQRREQIIGDCFQLKVDVDVYNDMNAENPPMQLILDFTDDVAEREQMNDNNEDEDEAA